MDQKELQPTQQVSKIVLSRDYPNKLVVVVDNMHIEIMPGAMAGGIIVSTPGKELMTGRIDSYTLEVY
jgi:hypothetical protein